MSDEAVVDSVEELVVVVELGVLLVVLVVGRLEEAVVADVVAVELEAGVVVDDEATVELVEGAEVEEEEEPLDRAKYAAAPATATTTTMITARKAAAMPLEEACK